MSDLWGTPQALFDKLDREFQFTLDVCALPENAKCVRYFTPEQDGLKQDWSGVVWMNPPFGPGIEKWLAKARDHAKHHPTVFDGWDASHLTNQGVVVAIVPTRTNAPWWHEFVMQASEIRFIKKKVKFVSSDHNGVGFTGHAIVIFRPSAKRVTVSSFEWISRTDTRKEEV